MIRVSPALARAGAVFGLSAALWNAGAAAVSNSPLTLIDTVPIPNVTAGDFDHFAVDERRQRLYVSAEAHHSIEVFDLNGGAHIASASGVTTPHTIAFIADQHALFVADGGDASIRILGGSKLREIARIPLSGNPDAGLYDARSRIFFVGTTAKGQATSVISMISVDRRSAIGAIPVPSANVESMVVDHTFNRLIVNLRDKKEIGVIDLARRRLIATWFIAGMNRNTTMQLDALHRRLFVAGRKPGTLFILDADRGRLIAHLPCVETADDMTYSAHDRRIYVSGAGGLDVFAQSGPDRYRRIARYETHGGKTSIEVPAEHRFFVVHTKSAATAAGLQVFRIN